MKTGGTTCWTHKQSTGGAEMTAS